jgi:DNA-binding transcriptional ArsR family regulator
MSRCYRRLVIQPIGCTLLRMAGLTPELARLVARRFALLGDPTRVRLLDAMHERREASVGELAAAIGASHANVSKHLNLLLAERMVGRRREGAKALYRITDATLIDLCEAVCAGVRQSVRELNALLEDPTSEGALR